MPPKIVSLADEANTQVRCENHPIADVNDQVVRISVMTVPYHWHHHPNSDETFLSVEGELIIEFDDGTQVLRPGQLLTVPRVSAIARGRAARDPSTSPSKHATRNPSPHPECFACGHSTRLWDGVKVV